MRIFDIGPYLVILSQAVCSKSLQCDTLLMQTPPPPQKKKKKKKTRNKKQNKKPEWMV